MTSKRTFADHFSGHASDYATARPTYPGEMFDWLLDETPNKTDVFAWDCATGNGQAAAALAERNARVFATDASQAQLSHATLADRVCYVRSLAEATPLADNSVDLCVVAQAAHWFDLDEFFGEVARVVKPGGLVALWCYTLFRVDEVIDGIVDELYGPILGDFWPPDRHHIESAYRGIRMPFNEIPSPLFEMRADWDFDQVCAYLRSWSAAQRFLDQKGRDAIAFVARALEKAWGEDPIEVVWPVHLRVGRVR